MDLTNKESFLNRKPSIHPVDLPSGDTVSIVKFNGTARDRCIEVAQDENNKTSYINSVMFVYSVCNEIGELIFDENDVELINSGKFLPADDIDEVVRRAMRINGMDEESAEEAEKN